MELKEVLRHRLGPGSDADRHEARRALRQDPGYRQTDSLPVGGRVTVHGVHIARPTRFAIRSTADNGALPVGVHRHASDLWRREGSGMGEASSSEQKYKWRKAYQSEFDATPETLRRTYQGFDKTKRQRYTVMQNPRRPADLITPSSRWPTSAPCSPWCSTSTSDCFTQDLEDMDEAARPAGARRRSRRWRRAAASRSIGAASRRRGRMTPSTSRRRAGEGGRAGLKTVDNIPTMAATKKHRRQRRKPRCAPSRRPSRRPPPPRPPSPTPRWPRSCTPRRTSRPWTTPPALINAVPDQRQQAELTQIYEARAADLAQ